MIMETDTFFISYKKYNSIEINSYIKYSLVTFSIYIPNVEKGNMQVVNVFNRGTKNNAMYETFTSK